MLRRSALFAPVFAAVAALPLTAQPAGPPVRTLFEADWIYALTGSPDGRFVLYRAEEGWQVFERATGRRHALDVDSRSAAWSPAGDRIAFDGAVGDRSHVFTIPVDQATGKRTGPVRRISVDEGQMPAFAPDGRELAFVTRAGAEVTLVIVPVNGGRERVLHAVPQDTAATYAQLQAPKWSPDGRWIYVTHVVSPMDVSILRVPAGGGAPERVATGSTWVGPSPDGGHLASAAHRRERGVVHIMDASGRDRTAFVTPYRVEPEGWSSDGRTLLGTESVVLSALHAYSVPDGSWRSLTGDWAADRFPAHSPDGRRIAYQTRQDGRSHIALIDDDGRNRRVLTWQWEPAGGPQWSPDGTRIAFLAGDVAGRALIVVDVATGSERRIATLPARRAMIRALYIPADQDEYFHWRADGRALVYTAVTDAGSRVVIRETDLEGVTRDLHVRPPGRSVMLLSAELAVDIDGNELILIHPHVAGERRLPLDGRAAGSAYVVGMSEDWLAVWRAIDTPLGRRSVTQLVPFDGSAVQTLRTGMDQCRVDWVKRHPGGQLLLVGGLADESCGASAFRFHVVSLNGEPVRNLTASSPALDFNQWSLSPDGSTLVVEAQGGWSRRAIEIDLSAILQGKE